MNNSEMLLRKLIRETLATTPAVPAQRPPKGEWVSVEPGDPLRPEIQQELFDIVQSTYAGIGGHFKIGAPGDLERYKYWVVQDLDDDPEMDVLIFAKPDVGGTKMGGAGNDGSPAAAKAYKAKSAELRSGGSIGSGTNWWGEVSDKPAFAMISRGAPAIEDEATVSALLAGDDFVFHGEHPDPDVHPMFKSVKGWYTKKFGNKSSTKIILGNPSV